MCVWIYACIYILINIYLYTCVWIYKRKHMRMFITELFIDASGKLFSVCAIEDSAALQRGEAEPLTDITAWTLQTTNKCFLYESVMGENHVTSLY